MAGFEVRRNDGEVLGPATVQELRARRISPTEQLRHGGGGGDTWSSLSGTIAAGGEARAELEAGLGPGELRDRPLGRHSLYELSWPITLLLVDAFWFVKVGLRASSAGSWAMPLTLAATIAVTVAGLVRRRPWAWALAGLICAAISLWLLLPLVAAPSLAFALPLAANVLTAVFLFVRRPRGPALDWPEEWRRLLRAYSADPAAEARPRWRRAGRAGPVAAVLGAAAFLAIAVAGVTLYNSFRFPGRDFPLSFIPRGGDLWSHLVAFGVYGLMVLLAVLLSLRGGAVLGSLGLGRGQGFRRSAWTGFRLFLVLFVVLLAGRWAFRSVEALERRLQGPAATVGVHQAGGAAVSRLGQVRTAVQGALDRMHGPRSLSLRHLLLVAVALLLIPVCEEVFFRGLIFGGLRRSLPFWAAASLSAAIFAACHGWGLGWGLAGPVLWFEIFAGGLAAASAYERAGSLAAAVVFHVLWNATQTATQIAFTA